MLAACTLNQRPRSELLGITIKDDRNHVRAAPLIAFINPHGALPLVCSFWRSRRSAAHSVRINLPSIRLKTLDSPRFLGPAHQ